VTIVIRPVQRSEVVDYLRVLPFANGLPSWEPAPAAWHSGAGAWPTPSAPISVETLRGWIDDVMADGFRSQAAFVDGHLVGGSALLSLELTVPGARTVRMGGVTSTGVVATHRRRGLLRQMMQAMFTDAQDHGEFVIGLSASEGGIYGRFGFSPATQRTRWELDRSDAALIDAPPPRGSLELVDAATARGVWPRLHDTVRARRVGEVSAQPDQWEQLSDASTGTDGPLRYLLHRDDSGRPDGIAHYRIPWGPGPDDVGTVAVEALEALGTDAYTALWGLLVDLDLSRRIVAAPRPVDEPLRWMLRNPRALRVTRLTDNLWLRLLDVAAALQARSFDTPGVLVFEIRPDAMCPANTGTWRLTADPTGALCTRTNEAPDFTLDVQSLASLFLGGVSPAALAAAGRIVEHRTGALAQTARLFATDPLPYNAVGF
jgi:predicted acetyltransferase